MTRVPGQGQSSSSSTMTASRSMKRRVGCPPRAMVMLSVLLAMVSSMSNVWVQADEIAETEAPTSAPTELGWLGCSPDGSSIRKGKEANVCFTLGPAKNWAEEVTYMRWVFKAKVDEYARFHIPESYKELVSADAIVEGLNHNLTVHTAVQTKLSFLRLFVEPTTDDQKSPDDRIFPYLTAIVDVKDGIVKGIAWDNACVFCGSKRCVENTYNFAGESTDTLQVAENTKACYLTRAECQKLRSEDPNNTDCDLKLHVVWTGSDVNGEALLSSANRYSAFPPSRLQDRVTIPSFDVKGAIDNVNPFAGDDEEQEGGNA